jgi:hypothetical protein
MVGSSRLVEAIERIFGVSWRTGRADGCEIIGEAGANDGLSMVPISSSGEHQHHRCPVAMSVLTGMATHLGFQPHLDIDLCIPKNDTED